MRRTFTDILRAACQAVNAALAQSAVAPVAAVDLQQVCTREQRYDVVAAAHYQGGELRRVIVGCDRPLAVAFGQELALDASSTADPARSGLRLFTENLHRALAARLATTETTSGFLLHDSASFRVRAQGARNFSLQVATAAGELQVLIDLAPHVIWRSVFAHHGQRRGATVVDTGSDLGIVDQEVIARIMAHLARNEADVELKVPVDRDRIRLLPATVVGSEPEAAGGNLVITAAGLGERTSRWRDGTELELVFIVQERLLQCACRVIGSSRLELDAGVSLPLLTLDFPQRVTYGQRRGAFRIVPRDRLHGAIRRRAVAGETVGCQDFPFQVIDVSCTGLLLAMLSNTLLSDFKWGTPVTSRIELPLPYGAVTIKGTVRRLTLNPAKDGHKAVNLGVEFTDDQEQDPALLATLRAYVRDHQRRNLEGDVQVTACPA